MRKWFVIAMLFLLPLRGLVGDAMAYSMLPEAPKATASTLQGIENLATAHAVFDWTKVSFYPQNHTETASNLPCHSPTAQTDANDSDTAQNQCTACQACHLGALTDTVHAAHVLQSASSAPAQQATQWHSADPRLLAKTPVL